MNEIADAELPEGWIAVPFSDVGKARMGPTILAKDLHETGLAVYSAGQANKPWGYTQRQVPEFQHGTVVVSARGSIGFPKIPSEEVFTSTQTTIAINPTAVTSSRYLQRFLQTVDWADLSSGAAIPMLTISMLGELVVPIAPLAEQKRLADKLESVLGRVDACRARLDRVPDLLKRFRQSVLAAATSGQLTEDWRTTNHPIATKGLGQSNRVDVSPIAEDEKSFDIPDVWEWARLGSLATLINGDRGKNYPNQREYVSEGIPFINTGHIQPDGSLSAESMNFITRKKFDSLNSGKIRPGDLVYCLRGATLGKTAFVAPYEVGAIASSLVIIRPDKALDHRFVFYYLTSPFGKELVGRFDNGSAQPNLAAQSVRQYVLPLPTLAEQAEIVRRVEALFALADRIEARLATAQRLVERLTPATLSKAFRGDLVPQDPNDEPASKLLERVRGSEAPMRTTKRKKSS